MPAIVGHGRTGVKPPFSIGGAETTLEIRKVVVLTEEIRRDGDLVDPDGPLVRVAAGAVIRNPYAGRPSSPSLAELVGPSSELARLLAARAQAALGAPVDGYGKAAIVGLGGEQEHGVACLTSAFGDAVRDSFGGGKAWIPSATKRAAAGARIDVPTAYRHALWVRSHYDTITVSVEDAPMPNEILVVLAVTNRGRLNARLGGLEKQDVRGEDGLR